MSISSTTRKAGPFAGNGAQTVFAFAFKVFLAADLVATRAVASVETVLTLGVDYTVALNADQDNAPGGTVTLGAALAVGATLAITSNVDSLQAVVITNGGGFFPSVFNTVFDKLTILAQQLAEKIGRAMIIPVTATGVTSLAIPVVASGVLQWKPDGSGLQAVTLPSLALSLALPGMAGKAGQFLTNDGVSVSSWANTTAAAFSFTGGLTVGGGLTATGGLSTDTMTVSKQLIISGVINPTAVNGTLNDYAPANLSNATTLRVTTSALALLTGLTGGVGGRRIQLEGDGVSPLVLLNQSTLSTAANRFMLPGASYSVAPGASVMLQYDSTASRWRVAVADREVLYANRTYFVATTGNDANDGLSAGTAFLTGQKAADVAYALDFNGFTVTIQHAAGTYAGQITLNGVPPGVKAMTQLVILGDAVTPANVVFSFNVASTGVVVANNGALAQVRGIRFNAAAQNPICIQATSGAQVQFDACDFGVAFTHLYARDGGRINGSAAYTISGSANAHMRAEFGGRIIITAGITVTLTGTPAFGSGFAYIKSAASIEAFSTITWTGAATGARYNLNGNGVLDTNGGGTTILPGSTVGITATGGVYI